MDGVSLDIFYIIFKLILMQFQSKYFPPQFQLIGWVKHLVYLHYNNHEEPKCISIVNSISQNDNSNSSKIEIRNTNHDAQTVVINLEFVDNKFEHIGNNLQIDQMHKEFEFSILENQK